MKKSGLIAIIIIVLFIIFVVFKLSGNKKIIEKGKTAVDRTHIPVSVNIAKAEMLILSNDVTRPAVVEPNETAVISANMPGKLVSFDVELGTKVSKGQIIGKIDVKTLEVQKKSLELAAEKMKTDYLRNKELYEGNALSEAQYLDTKFAYEARVLELEQLTQQIEDANIKSPLSGIITEKRNVEGEFVGAGTPIATVVDVDLLKIYAFVNQSEVRFINLSQKVNIKAPVFNNKLFHGKVTYISPNADENYNYKIEIKIDTKENSELKAGTYVNVQWVADSEEKVLQIPKKALVEGVKNAYVFVKKGDRAVKTDVEAGRENGEYIEIAGGLKENDEVVIDGQVNIVDNSLIQSK